MGRGGVAMTGPGPGVPALIARLAIAPQKLGSLFLCGDIQPEDVSWLVERGLAYSDGDTLRLVRKDGTR